MVLVQRLMRAVTQTIDRDEGEDFIERVLAAVELAVPSTNRQRLRVSVAGTSSVLRYVTARTRGAAS